MNKKSRAVGHAIAAILCVSLVAGFAYAQDEEEPRDEAVPLLLAIRDLHQDAWQIESREAFKAQIDEIGLPDERSVIFKVRADRNFRESQHRLDKAIEGFKTAIDAGSSLQKPARELEKVTSDISSYLKSASVKPPNTDSHQVRALEGASLVHEAVASAEQTLHSFDQIVSLLQSGDDTVSTASLARLRDFHASVVRLRLLASKIRETPERLKD